MPITPTATRTGSYSVKYDWSGTAPFDVWQDGIKVRNQTTATTYTAQTTDGTTNPLPAVEILDSTDTDPAQSSQYSPLVKFQWQRARFMPLLRLPIFLLAEWATSASTYLPHYHRPIHSQPLGAFKFCWVAFASISI